MKILRQKKFFFGDIKDFDFDTLENIEIVAGGPPCQPFSIGGKHKAHQDNRDMFPYAIHAIKKLKPKAFIFENVKGLLRQSFTDYFKYIILKLTYPNFAAEANSDWQKHLNELCNISSSSYTETKYNVQFKLINAANYGVPQTRERVVIVGIRSDLKCLWSFPPETHSADKLFWDMHVTGEYWERHKICKSKCQQFEKSIENKIFRIKEKFGIFEPALTPWQTLRDALKDLSDPSSNHGISDHIFHDGARIYPGHTGSILDYPAKTIKAGDHGVPGGENMIRFPNGTVRYLTVFEAKRLQTFPDNFLIKGVWGEAMRQIGNAVPVLLAETIGHELIKTLNEHDQYVAAKKLKRLIPC